ncbi:MAG: hypothetical protein ABFS02_13045 [Pseudomonadota bacterium]
MTFRREEDVVGWARHIMGGSFSSGDAVVESVDVWGSIHPTLRTHGPSGNRYRGNVTPSFSIHRVKMPYHEV